MKCLILTFLVCILSAATQTCYANQPAKRNSQPASGTTIKSGSTVKALELKQTHYFYGDLDIIASRNAIRMEDTGSWKFVLVAKAPDWNVTVYRNDDKIYFTEPLEQFIDTGLVSQFLVARRDRSFGQGTLQTLPTSVAGVRCKRISDNHALLDYIPHQTLVEPQIVHILYETMRVPTNNEIALRFVQSKAGTDWMTGLKESGMQIFLTTKSAKSVVVNSKIFDKPVGYKLSKSLREVLISNARRESSSDAKDLFEINK